jgi:hypothetical protein
MADALGWVAVLMSQVMSYIRFSSILCLLSFVSCLLFLPSFFPLEIFYDPFFSFVWR